MMRGAAFWTVLAIAMSGCLAGAPEDPSAIRPGFCNFTLPDGTTYACENMAAALEAADGTTGFVCTDTTLDGTQGTAALWRHPLTDEVLLQLDLADSGSHGIVYEDGNPLLLWGWNDVPAQSLWSLGERTPDASYRIKVYDLEARDVASPQTPVTSELRWTFVELDGRIHPYPIQDITVQEDHFYVDSNVRVDRAGAASSYALAHVDFTHDDHRIHVQVTPLLDATLSTALGAPACGTPTTSVMFL